MSNYSLSNKDYYDQLGEQNFDAPHALELARRAANVFRRAYDFDEDETRVLDFACGVGHLSRELVPYVKSIVGVDISQRMVDEYNRRSLNQGIEPEEMRAIQADILLSSTSSELQEMKGTYDVVVCAAAYHHFDDITVMTRALVEFLKPGGMLLVLDLLKDENVDTEELFPEHRKHDIVAHRGGLSKAQMEEAFVAATGLQSFKMSDAIKARKRGHPTTLFLAQGIRLEITSVDRIR
ncbi:hypothetical protein AGABI1DRAFT_69361 [Agaricus bisporus var. burnettii JB137-S8]|uniref:Methyltransferase domain-containing protein n=1 Tax=Agaricus bisporus var. burnettii (strain JB137-S8 / ATCC MYA-4627 / FGSC 10392) TaxID=597362 RepID=K5XI54_AGABU|nr:uncharacterized protein AGABI1DRAFT_69361 [Agaricus bisporus var. burnettii JB137-S8]EKM83148.1 hypothetical protein AGABI1DRAFT_69361 [Agaricus bisporus var. burnettii JB137-S8]